MLLCTKRMESDRIMHGLFLEDEGKTKVREDMTAVIDLERYELPRKDSSDDVIRKVGKAIKKHCTCNGRGPRDVLACTACKIWNDLQFDLRGHA